MTVTATSESAGSAVIENQTTGKTVTKTFNGNVEGDLCLENAEWIVEDVSLPIISTSLNPNLMLTTLSSSRRVTP